MKHIYEFITETNNFNRLVDFIFENRNYEYAKNAVRKYAKVTDIDKVQTIIHTTRIDVPNSRNLKDKYLGGVIRILYNEEIYDDAECRETLNDIIDIICKNSTYTNKYDRNLNGLYFEELQQELYEDIQNLLKQEKDSISNSNSNCRDGYEVVPIQNYETAKKYQNYTDWCITKNKFDYDTYTQNNEKFYFVLKDGYEEIPKVENSNEFPKDEYGLSMIAISVRKNGRLALSTTRWNDTTPNNKSLSAKDISDLLDCNFYKVFKP